MKVVALIAALCIAGIVSAQTDPQPIRFTRYDPAHGRPHIDDAGDVSFSGRIRVSGTLRVERDVPELCGGACAYFVPDRESQRRLPREIRAAGPIRIKAIHLYDAAPILERLIGARETGHWLASRQPALSMPVTLTLTEYRIYGACDAIHHEARAVDARSQGRPLSAGIVFGPGGC